MKIRWGTELPMWLLLAAIFLLAAGTWPAAPERIPIHWNARGEIDGYGGKFSGLLLLPLIATGVYLLTLFLSRIDPGRANYPKFWKEYGIVRFGILAVLAAVYGIVHASIRGVAVKVESAVPLIIAILFVLIGLVSPRIKPNWFFGIRTPWTLSSRLSWEKTHHLGGWMFVIAGTLIAFSVIVLPAGASRVAFMAIAGAAVGVTVAYSYFVWRADEAKEPAISRNP